MSLEAALLREHSRSNTDFLTNYILRNPEMFEELWIILLKNEDPLSRKAAWVADYCAEIRPDLIVERVEELAQKVSTFKSDGLKRHALRMLSRTTLPVQNLGYLIDVCFKWLENKSETVAVKVYCMLILSEVCKQLPELTNELLDIINIQMPEATPGFKTCGKKIIKQLSKT
ncbi:MAG: hypothetical protein PHX54_00680 [Lentimicrobiaceae bacterium]|nr:hypothetical protein [Lentimicrobiaceae bacterium]